FSCGGRGHIRSQCPTFHALVQTAGGAQKPVHETAGGAHMAQAAPTCPVGLRCPGQLPCPAGTLCSKSLPVQRPCPAGVLCPTSCPAEERCPRLQRVLGLRGPPTQ
ncbi:hypothetical protein COCCADRAFT_94905, partial [Bipolaris zeicola 26-R-13]